MLNSHYNNNGEVIFLKDSPFSARLQKTTELMLREGIDCLIVTPSSDMKYLCGYSIGGDERFLALIVAPGKEPFIIANALYELQVTETPITEFAYWSDGSDPFELLRLQLSQREIRTDVIAIHSAMPALFSLPIAQMYPAARLCNMSPLIQTLRLYKDRAEMDAMIAATAKADAALEACIGKGTYWLGKTESEFLAEFVMEMTRLGLNGAGGIVAVGANAAIPHHHTGNTVIESGKCLLIDFGGTYMNYNTDMTRTFFFGKPEKEFVDVYNIVLEACLAGEAAAKAGNRLEDVDIAARGVIRKYGYGDYFIHRTGHGIGIDGHEGPSAGIGEKTVIAPGMAFSCEPGIYLPGRFGVRIEDQVLIEQDGSTRILHSFPKQLMCFE